MIKFLALAVISGIIADVMARAFQKHVAPAMGEKFFVTLIWIYEQWRKIPDGQP